MTYSPTHQMTRQEIFDKVFTHLLTQKYQAITDDGQCEYLANNGLKCAVGCLIAEDQLPQVRNTDLVDDVRMAPFLRASGIDDSSPTMDHLVDLQLAHDRSRASGEAPFLLRTLAPEFETLAQRHGLTFTIPKGFA